MAAVLQAPPATDTGTRKRFTQEDVSRMMDAGLFEGERFELIDGDLIDKMGQEPPHAHGIRRLTALFANIFGIDRVLVHAPVQVGSPDRQFNLPEPDIAVVAEDRPEYADRHPSGNELLLAVEVADTSLRSDLRTKRDLYARAGVPEYWVLDIP